MSAFATTFAIEDRATAASPATAPGIWRPVLWQQEMQGWINASRSDDPAHLSSGKYISNAVADAASDFFNSCGDVLHNQPYIYASQDGALLADFDPPRGRFTVRIGSGLVRILAATDGQPIHEAFAIGGPGLREKLAELQRG